MTEKRDQQPTTKQNIGQAISLGAILLGLLCIVAGIWLLNSTPKAAPVAAATPEPVASEHREASQVATRESRDPERRKGPSPTVPPTKTPAPKVLKPTPTVVHVATLTLPPDILEPSPTPTVPPVILEPGLFHLAIVHSNDTWGYLMPCG